MLNLVKSYITIRKNINYCLGERKGNNIYKLEPQPTRKTSRKKYMLNVQVIGNWQIAEIFSDNYYPEESKSCT